MKPAQNKTRILKYGFTLLALLALCVCLTGCGDDEHDDGVSAHPFAWMPI